MAGPTKFYEEIGPEHMEPFQLIGCGAFGTIYQSRHRDWGIDVAVKILNRSNATFSREELLREAHAMDKARFPYILRLFGLYVDHVQPDSPSLGLVMEYMENGSLSTLKERVSFVPWALRFRILHEVALGMNFLHNLRPPLLHLDLKPSNVLLEADVHVRVADFGLSKFKRGTTRLSSQACEEEGYGGTLEYLPPEAFGDLNYKPTLSTDVYSYGILMWSVLNGQEPYAYLPPGNMSSLISRLIPQGQRPCTEDLEMIVDVQKLENMITLMKSCWHNDKTKRPSFRECTQKAEDVYNSHKSQIMAAVRKVQDILVSCFWCLSEVYLSPVCFCISGKFTQELHRNSSSFKKTELTSVQDRRKASLSPQRPHKLEQQRLPSYSSELEKQLETMHLVESPSWQNEAVLPEASTRGPEGKLSAPHVLQRSRSACLNQAEEEEEAKTEELHYSEVKRRTRPNISGGKPRPHSDTFLSPPHQPHHPGSYPQLVYGHQRYAGLTYPDHSLLSQFHSGHTSQYGGICIQGHNISGVQIGDCNSMHIQKNPERKSGKRQ